MNNDNILLWTDGALVVSGEKEGNITLMRAYISLTSDRF